MSPKDITKLILFIEDNVKCYQPNPWTDLKVIDVDILVEFIKGMKDNGNK